jgi:FixJ family two-component response regulator
VLEERPNADIVSALRRKAGRGDVNAARELREWSSRENEQLRSDAWMQALTPRERAIVRRLIERALKRAGHAVDPAT